MKIRITLEYDGSNYSGWQLQDGQDSIQARLEAVLERIFLRKIRVHGSGRTDAGVHALGQVAAFDLPRHFAPAELKRAMNSLLPPDLAIIEAAAASEDFDPRRHARLRAYEYRVINRDRRSAFDFRYAGWCPRRWISPAMNAAARRFIGEHDFAAFRSLGSEEKTTLRRVFISEWSRDGNRYGCIASRRAASCATWCARWSRRWSRWTRQARAGAGDGSDRSARARAGARFRAALRSVPGRGPLLSDVCDHFDSCKTRCQTGAGCDRGSKTRTGQLKTASLCKKLRASEEKCLFLKIDT